MLPPLCQSKKMQFGARHTKSTGIKQSSHSAGPTAWQGTHESKKTTGKEGTRCRRVPSSASCFAAAADAACLLQRPPPAGKAL